MTDSKRFEKELLQKFRRDLEYRHYMLTYYHVPLVVLMTKLKEEPPVQTKELIEPIMLQVYASIILKRRLRNFSRINTYFLTSFRKNIIRVFGKNSSQTATITEHVAFMKIIFQAIEQLPAEERVTYKTCMIATYPKKTNLAPEIRNVEQTTITRIRAEQMIRASLIRSRKEALPFFEDILRCRNVNA